ncbi:MAG: P44/Msp2 family outer membrane protein [Acidobacteria bacterium]|nr:P44/Msp2 family outer membrane protein [Acidobacteriota bacterium]MYI75547.1 P44/Msp2 family outer membrane protein [Acidobacteriota bacterium]
MFELAAGYVVNQARLELSFGQRRNDVDQMFSSVTTFDGVALEDRRGSTVTSNTSSSIDNLTVRTLAFNAYYDFRNAATGFSPYVGAGVGPAFVDVRGVRFSDEYFDTASNGAAYDPPLSSYNASLDADFSDTVLAGHVHAGADFGLNDRTALGVKLTYSILGDAEYTGTYDMHAAHRVDPDFTHTDTFAGTRYWSVQFTVRYVLGG